MPGSLLVVYEGEKRVPFNIARIFVINAIKKSIRGSHAHKECTQLLVVLNGKCKIICDDGFEKKEIILDHACKGLLIPPTIWAEQEYQPGTTLMVLTDKPYDEQDYIRDYESFIRFRHLGK